MSYFQGRDLRKESGGVKKTLRKKRKRELGSPSTETLLAEDEERYIERISGGSSKVRVKSVIYANLSTSAGKVKKVKITRVVSNPASVDYSRRGVITKGAVIETEDGQAKVTSRPGQAGVVNAVLVAKK